MLSKDQRRFDRQYQKFLIALKLNDLSLSTIGVYFMLTFTLPALKYLSRYLYRSVITEGQLIADDGESVTFSYRDEQSGKR